MYQNKKLATLLLRNEDWLISRILNSAKDNIQTVYSILINHSWRQTVKEFSDIIIKHSEKPAVFTYQSILYCLEKSNLGKFPGIEAERCFQRNVEPHIYLTFLKTIRKAYEELINDSRFNQPEKKEYITILNNCFDCLEIAFIDRYSIIKTNKQNEKNSIIEDKNLFEKFFESTSIPLLILDTSHRIINHNSAASKIFPFLFAENGLSKKNMLSFDDKDIFNSKIDEFKISNHKEASFEVYIKLNKTDTYFNINLKKIKDTEFVLASFIDLSKWKELEKNLEISKQKAEESDKLKTAFLANMSHEIRTPMNAIVGFAELLTMSNPGPEERNEYLSLIKKSSNDLLNIIEDIIDIAKIESKQLRICPKNTSLYELFSDLELIYSDVLLKLGKDKVKILSKIPEREKKLVCHTDPKRLKQVLSNLIGNAIKFTDQGQIEIGYKLAENKIIYFFVKDSGIGIPFHMQKKIFEQYIQVEETFDKNTNGTGLGLAICKNIISLLGGKIWVASQPNRGANFYFYLPFMPPLEKPHLHIPKADVISSNADLSDKCILIAEDEEINFLFLRESLKSTGVKILWAKNGFEAINFAEIDNSINLILMDIKMPEVSGLEATRYITHIRPALPIVALSAFAMDNDRQACIDAGCIDYFAKPITHDRLYSIIHKYLKKSSLEPINSQFV